MFTYCDCQVRQVREHAVSYNMPRNRKESWDDENRTHVLLFTRPSIQPFIHPPIHSCQLPVTWSPQSN